MQLRRVSLAPAPRLAADVLPATQAAGQGVVDFRQALGEPPALLLIARCGLLAVGHRKTSIEIHLRGSVSY
jgi:hypothetical protein